jgi:hypothetical protein
MWLGAVEKYSFRLHRPVCPYIRKKLVDQKIVWMDANLEQLISIRDELFSKWLRNKKSVEAGRIMCVCTQGNRVYPSRGKGQLDAGCGASVAVQMAPTLCGALSTQNQEPHSTLPVLMLAERSRAIRKWWQMHSPRVPRKISSARLDLFPF